MKLKFYDIEDNLNETYGVNSVRLGIRNLILTRKGEMGHNLDFGCELDDFLFELCTDEDAEHLKLLILDCLSQEERIDIHDIQVTPVPDEHAFHVTLVYSIPEINATDTFVFKLMR